MSEFPKAYAFSCSDKNILNNSSSGGAFYCIASHYIKNLHGVVYGVQMNESHVEHTRIDNIDNLHKIMKSKYVRSDLKNTFNECANDLILGLDVVYSGTPCQIAALVSFLDYKKINREKLLTIDLICHGTPDPKYWNMYLKEKFPNQKILNVDFRYKKPSWENYSIKIKTNKKTYVKSIQKDEYMTLFLNNYTLCESCFNCHFKGLNRKSDVTLGDFWGVSTYYPEYLNKKGTSLIFIYENSKIDQLLKIFEIYGFLSIVNFGVATYKNSSYSLSAKKPDNYELFKNKDHIIFSKKFIKRKQSIRHLTKCFINKILKIILNINKPYKNIPLTGNEIGIITDYGYSNFGNRLQNYALRYSLCKLGYKPININLDFTKKKIFYIFYQYYLFIRCYKKEKRKSSIKKAALKSGETNFYFDYNYNNIPKLNHIIVGSDQVWNSSYHISDLPFNLGFLKTNGTSISSYAASIGTYSIPSEKEYLFKDLLSNFKNISVRENNAKIILNKMNIQSRIVCDPSLLLSATEWDMAIDNYSSINLPNKKYIFKYLLKEKDDQSYDNEICPLDKKSNYYFINHFDFINLLKNSDLIITDSFHAFIFSIIYKKRVKLIVRKDMFSRFDILLKLLNIKSNNLNDIIDFSKINCIKINEFIAESTKYLEESTNEFSNTCPVYNSESI